MTREEAARLLLQEPVRVGQLCGYSRLTDELHGTWMRSMLLGRGDMTLLAHRGSCKTTCVAMVMAILLIVRPQDSLLFFRKTEDDAEEIIRQVKVILQKPVMRYLAACVLGRAPEPVKSTALELTLSSYAAPRGAAQLAGGGIGGSVTGRHAEWVFTDDIVNLKDRVSPAEREHTRSMYMELQNIRSPGGRIINTGTPWHREDALALMPGQQRFDCYTTGLLDSRQLAELRQSMAPSLFAANYELRHIAQEGALFDTPPVFTEDETLLWDGIAHIDAAYGGEDSTALTLCRKDGGRYIMYGRLWKGHVDNALKEIMALCDHYRCAPAYCETNGDKGYLAAELRRRGMPVRMYAEKSGKYIKIATHLKRAWRDIVFVKETDPEYLGQILDYTEFARHDDAPDSASCTVRAVGRM